MIETENTKKAISILRKQSDDREILVYDIKEWPARAHYVAKIRF